MSDRPENIRVFGFSDPSNVLQGIDDLRDYVNENGQCIVRGAVDSTVTRNSVKALKRGFSEKKDVRRSLEFKYGQTPNFQRLDIGTYGGGVVLFCRTFFIFPWNDDRLHLADSLVAIARIKNALHELPDAYCLRGEEPVFYGMAIHQYPRGGGFMSGHRHSIEKDDDEGMRGGAFARHYTVGLVMSKIGEDFAEGGGWSMPHVVKAS